MTHSAKILADSISPDGVRLVTLECTYPRIVHAEMMTHRVFSRNAASSRAIPVEKMIRMVQEHPYVPTHWGKNQKGMQADEEVEGTTQREAELQWLRARDHAVDRAQNLIDAGIHKQITNRLLEPFLWYTCIITATEWDNFFHLRCHKDAHPEIRRAAELMREAMAASEPKKLGYGDWHAPLIVPEDWINGDPADVEKTIEVLCKVSVGRCARVSYLTHDSKRDPAEDIALCDRLLAAGHMSPFEHVARPMTHDEIRACTTRRMPNPLGELSFDGDPVTGFPVIAFAGNFRGWVQFRKLLPNEHDVLGAR